MNSSHPQCMPIHVLNHVKGMSSVEQAIVTLGFSLNSTDFSWLWLYTFILIDLISKAWNSVVAMFWSLSWLGVSVQKIRGKPLHTFLEIIRLFVWIAKVKDLEWWYWVQIIWVNPCTLHGKIGDTEIDPYFPYHVCQFFSWRLSNCSFEWHRWKDL